MIFLDTETTGLKDPRLVELAFAEAGHFPIVVRCKPTKEIELDATVVNGIRNKDVVDCVPFRENAHYPWIKKQLESNTIVMHNAPFDIGVLESEGIFIKDFIDTKVLAKETWKDAPSHRLQHLRYWLDLDVDGAAHTALGDVQVLQAVYDAMQTGKSAPAPVSRARRTSVKLPKGWKKAAEKAGVLPKRLRK